MKMKSARKAEKQQEKELLAQPIVKKISAEIKMGYVPKRGCETYQFCYQTQNPTKENQMLSDIINCFGHAFFNLTNDMYKKYKIGENDTEAFWHFGDKFGITLIDEILDYVRSTGLHVEPCDFAEKMKNNQWKVAFFLKRGTQTGYHFFLQEKDGSWTSKNGKSSRVECIKGELPREWRGYELQETYCVTNPYASACTNNAFERGK